MIAKIDCITRYEIRQYIEKGDKFLKRIKKNKSETYE